jgi:hypothetical protein
VLANPTVGLSTNASEAAAITSGVVSFENLLIIFLNLFSTVLSVLRVAGAIGRQSKLSQPERVIDLSCVRRGVYLSPEVGRVGNQMYRGKETADGIMTNHRQRQKTKAIGELIRSQLCRSCHPVIVDSSG